MSVILDILLISIAFGGGIAAGLVIQQRIQRREIDAVRAEEQAGRERALDRARQEAAETLEAERRRHAEERDALAAAQKATFARERRRHESEVAELQEELDRLRRQSRKPRAEAAEADDYL